MIPTVPIDSIRVMLCDSCQVVADPIGLGHQWQSRKFRKAAELQSIRAVMLAVKRIISKDRTEQLIEAIELITLKRTSIPGLKFTAQRCVRIGIHSKPSFWVQRLDSLLFAEPIFRLGQIFVLGHESIRCLGRNLLATDTFRELGTVRIELSQYVNLGILTSIFESAVDIE